MATQLWLPCVLQRRVVPEVVPLMTGPELEESQVHHSYTLI